MAKVRLKIDISGTMGSEAWDGLLHFPEAQEGWFDPAEGSSGPCLHGAAEPHRDGEWCAAVVVVENHLLAEYAVAHYLEQPRVIDAFVDG